MILPTFIFNIYVNVPHVVFAPPTELNVNVPQAISGLFMIILLSQALLISLKLIEQEDWRRQALRRNIMQLHEELKSLSWRLMASETPIQPLLVGDNEQAVQLSEALRERGILIPAIRPPTVPQGTARLRISLSAMHQPQDIERLGQTLRELVAP